MIQESVGVGSKVKGGDTINVTCVFNQLVVSRVKTDLVARRIPIILLSFEIGRAHV